VSNPQDLQLRVEREQGLVYIQLSGIIDEKFDAARLLREMAPLTVLDVSGVRRITSFGVRQWSEAMKALPTTVKHLYLLRCPPVFVDQLNMVLNFGGRSEVVSAYAVYVCEKCGKESQVLLDLLADRASIAGGQLPEAQCADCKLPMHIADDAQLYVRLVNEFGAKNIDPEAASLMERRGLHALRKVGKPPEAIKLVHEKVTLFRLSGTLDGRFRQRRLASGVEGDVVFDLADIEGVDAVGAERWRELLGELASATTITLVDVPDVLLPAIAEGRFAVKGSGLYSYQATFQCADCGNLEVRPLRADEPLAACTRNCTRCGRTAGPITDVSLIEAVFNYARPAAVSPAVEDVIKNRHEILSRARAESGALPQSTSTDSISRYRVVRPLSEGGMAEIFLAVHQGIAGFEKLVVLKKILRRMLERRHVAVALFLNEAKIAANLNHPNIVQTFEVGEHGGDLFIAMEYVHGVDVRRLLRQSILKQKPVPVEQVLYVAERVAAALHHAHTARDLSGKNLNVVHRDVSPSNIILGFDGQVKLLDFGVASASVGESFDGLIGKFSYMSPEQLAREPLDGRSDVFALGVVLHEMLSRRPLFRKKSDEETIRAVLHEPVPKLHPAVPVEVDVVLQKALSRKAADRYSDARAFQVALEECIRKVGEVPSGEQLAHTLESLFPDQSAAPAFDPSLYRTSDSASPQPYRTGTPSAGSGESNKTRNESMDGDLTLVNNDSGVTDPSAVEPKHKPEPARAPEPAKKDDRVRFSTFPGVQPRENGAPHAASTSDSEKTQHAGADLLEQRRAEFLRATAALGPDEDAPPKTPSPKTSSSQSIPKTSSSQQIPKTSSSQSLPRTPMPMTPAPMTPAPMTPGPMTPLGAIEMPPFTPPPESAAPMAPLQLSPSTPLPAALAAVALEKRPRKSSDVWLIAAAVVAFIVGFLLVVF
jgi:serine/threonine-protein kinase